MDWCLETKLNITEQSDPYLNYYEFNHIITIDKNIDETNEMIKNILKNMNYTYSSKKVKSYYSYQITQLKIYRSDVALNIHKLSDNKTVIGFNIITSNNRLPSYRLMYSIIKKINPDTIVPRFIRESDKKCMTKEIYPITEIYITMIKSFFIDQINTGIKGIAESSCDDDNYYQLTPYLPYINDIMKVCNDCKNPKSIYECDIFTISSNTCARILFQSFKKGILDIIKYEQIIDELESLINNINYKDREQERIFKKSLVLLNQIKND